LRRLEVLLLAVFTAAFWVAEQRSIVDAHARLVRFEILLPDEAHVVRRDDRHCELDRKLERPLDVALLALAPGALQHEVITIPEERQPELERRARVGLPPVE